MIKGFVQGQTLKLAQTRVVADTIDYLIAKFHFQGEDWRGLEKWMHLQQGEQLYVIKLTEDRTQKSDHLNLSAGEWAVWLHGNETVNGSVTQRITTNVCAFTVERSGAQDGDAMPELPAGLGEQLQARVAALEGQEAELPLISEGDEGKVLMASGGQWIAADAPRGDADIVVDAALSATSENPVQNKVITQEFAALYQGVGASMEELSRRVTPEVTAEDNGRVLTVVDGAWTAAEASSGGGSADLGELFETVTEPQELLPRTAFTNEYFADFGAFGRFLDIDEATYNAWSANTEPVIVRYDGAEYVLEPQSIDPYGSGQPGIGVGNLAAFGGVGNGESFALVAMFDVNSDGGMTYGFLCGSMVDTTPTQHTLAMYLQGEAVKLKAAYVPGAVIRAYVEEYIDEALGGDY